MITQPIADGFVQHNMRGIESWCYALIYHGIVVYIGESNNLDARIRSHSAEKLFDEVQKFPVPENTKKARLKKEEELIRKFNPILNGGHVSKPAENIIETTDAIFLHKLLRSYKKIENKLLDPCSNHVGYLQDGIVHCFSELAKYHITRYDINGGWLSKEKMEVWFDQVWRNWEYYEFDAVQNKVIPKQSLPFRTKRTGDARLVEVKINTGGVFPFGKYKEQRIRDVLEKDPQYVAWFQENIPQDQWA